MDIIESASRVATIVASGRARYDDEPILQDALIRRVEIIGEAAARLSDEFKALHPQVPWRRAVAMRNRTAHGYFDIDLDLVWEVADKDVPGLASHVQQILDETS